MPVYAATPRFAERGKHPRALVLIIAGHAALLAAVMTARMDLPERIIRSATEVELIPLPKEPPPPEPPRAQPQPRDSFIERPVTIIPLPQPDRPRVEPAPMPLPFPGAGDPVGPSVDPLPRADPLPKADPVRVGPRFATPASRLKPPYPPEKLMREEEAALRLRLTINERGRVTAVDPVGSADRAFLATARRHLIAHWRYQPATEDGRPVPSSTVITLRFELND